MASAAGASLFLSFLPPPSQILLNNLLYGLALGHRLHPPLHDLFRAAQLRLRLPHLRRRLWVFHSGPAQFRSGWFVESLAIQTSIIFAIRTRPSPFSTATPASR
jgi:Mg2+-importing ATPase